MCIASCILILIKGFRKFVQFSFPSIWKQIKPQIADYFSPREVIEPWQDDPIFVIQRNYISQRTLIDEKRLYMLYQTLSHVCVLSGNVAEAGVYKGGSAYLLKSIIQKQAPNKVLHLFDTFSGMPEPYSQIDPHKKGGFG